MALLLVLGACLGSCSNKKDKKKLFETVPASTSGVFIVNLNEAMDQLEIKAEDGKVSYCSELSDIFSMADISKKDMKVIDKAITGIDMTMKTAVVFEYDDEPWATFFVDDQDDFIKMLEEETEAEFDEEEGFQVWEKMAIKDDQVWISTKIDTEAIDKFRDLDDEDMFSEKYAKITEELCADDLFSGYFIDLKLINQIAKRTGDSDMSQLNIGLGIAFDEAKYLYCTNKLNASGSSGEVRILNSKFEAAKFNLPMATIDAQSLSLLNNEAPVIAAVAIDKELVRQIENLAARQGMSSSDTEIFNIIKGINGTAAASLASATDGVAFMTFDNPNSPAAFSQMFCQGVDTTQLNFSTKGNMLIARLPGTPLAGRGTAPSELVGKYAGIYIDFSKDNGNFVNGADIAPLGKMWITLGPDGKGVKISSNWSIKNPLRTLLSTGLKIFKSAIAGKITSPEGEKLVNIFDRPQVYAVPDSTMAYDPYSDNEDPYAVPAFEPEPDYLY